jgi:hypothetical protein
MIEGTKTLCRDHELASQIRDFLAQHPVPSGRRTVQQILERLAVNVAFSARLVGLAGDALAAGASRLADR